jgi:hypothetical protein
MVQRFAAAAMAAPAPALAHPSPVVIAAATPPLHPAAASAPHWPHEGLQFDDEQRRWGGAARRVQAILDACLASGGRGGESASGL